PKSAWFMTQRIREGMKRDPLASMLAGTIVADETFIGGKPKNKHRQGRPVRTGGGGGTTHLQPVVALIDKGTGEARSAVAPKLTGATLRRVMAENVDMANS